MTGMEIELNLVGADFRPKMDNAEVLERIADPEYQTELARYNIEFNVAPAPAAGNSMLALETDLRTSLNRAQDKCRAGQPDHHDRHPPDGHARAPHRATG
jgi:hypothetical protein